MKNFLLYSFVALMAMIIGKASAQEVTLDFTLATGDDGKTSEWGFPAGSSNKTVEEKSFTYGNYTVKVAGSEGNGYYWHDKDHYLLFGKQGATLTLPAFDFDVERIDIEGTSGASTGIKQNIFVGDEAVSTETTGAKDVTNQFVIAEGKQAAGTIYTIKVTSNHNNQIKTIKIWKKGTSESGSDTPGSDPQTSDEVKTVTIAEFNAAAESNDVWYQLTGTVKNLKDGDQYGNFDLEDETGSVYVYGLLSEKGGAKKLFQELAAAKGIQNGSKITIIGNRGSYKDKIEVMNAYFVSIEEAAQGLAWNFTQWSEATIANLKADAAASKLEGWSDVEKKADAEAGADPTEASKDNCFWSVAEPNADGEMTANGVVIAELKGLKFYSVYSTARSLAIAVNYPSTSLGDYAGPSYLWLGGGKKKVPCFAIPSVAAGSTITMEVESHKPAEGRGVELYAGLSEDGKTVDDATKIGDTFNPTAKEAHTWTIAADCDVIVYNTNGCHIYTIKVEAGDPSGISTVKAQKTQNNAIYNLAGQKVGNDYKGIVIVNGRKFMQK